MNSEVRTAPVVRNRVALLAGWLALVFLTMPAQAQFTLTQISSDTFANSSSQHATEVEPDTYAWGNTIVSAFQVARVFSGGGADVGFATSIDGGQTWTSGNLPGLTANFNGGDFSAASDAVVAYDASHGQWLISTLPIGKSDLVAVSRSQDGINWGTPILVTKTIDSDKNWITCDNTVTSPFYGSCYVEWDSPAGGDLIYMSTSTDGGLTWGTAKNTLDKAAGIGGQPLVQPNGTVVVPIVNVNTGNLVAFVSINGGASWTMTLPLATVVEHLEAGNLRSAGLPSAGVDGAGNIYVVWSDCRFRTNCSTNDLVISTSTNGSKWTTPIRLALDDTTSTVDHFIPGLGVDPTTSGSTAHLAVTYYEYQNTNCTQSTCKLYVGFSTSSDGGVTWTHGKRLAGPMRLSWLPNTFSGLMVADYLGTSFVHRHPFGVFAVAKANSGSTFNQAMYTTTTPLRASLGEPAFSSKADRPVPGVKSDKPARKYYDDDGEYPIPPRKALRRSARK
jgi:hypothetical protein